MSKFATYQGMQPGLMGAANAFMTGPQLVQKAYDDQINAEMKRSQIMQELQKVAQEAEGLAMKNQSQRDAPRRFDLAAAANYGTTLPDMQRTRQALTNPEMADVGPRWEDTDQFSRARRAISEAEIASANPDNNTLTNFGSYRDNMAQLPGKQAKSDAITQALADFGPGEEQIQRTGTMMAAIEGKLPTEKDNRTQLERLMAAAGIDPRSPEGQQMFRAAVMKGVTHAPAARFDVNLNEEKEEAKAVGKGRGEQYVDIQNRGVAANSKMAKLDRMSQLLDGVATGKLTPVGTEIAAYADSLGIKIDKNLPNKQAAEALSNEIALEMRNPSGGAGMPGALSDKDREFLKAMAPGIGKTPEGNKLLIETAKKLAQREVEVARLARDYRQKRGTLDEGFYNTLQQWSEANPLFQGAKPAQAAPTPQGGWSIRRLP